MVISGMAMVPQPEHRWKCHWYQRMLDRPHRSAKLPPSGQRSRPSRGLLKPPPDQPGQRHGLS